jgi:hypothetical protein
MTMLLFPTYTQIAAASGMDFLGRLSHMQYVKQEVQGATAWSDSWRSTTLRPPACAEQC